MFILKGSSRAFITSYTDNTIVITSDYSKAAEFETIGEAMKAASEINERIESHLFKVKSIN